MMRSLYAGISGLKNHQTRMDVIGNNIANVNTVGFKGSRVTFQDMLSQTMQGATGASGNRGGTNPVQIGMGMGVASIDTNFADGSFQSTGKQTDLAIAGQGFFVLSDGANQVYTRAGSFDFDTAGNFLVPGTGYKVMGYKADINGVIDASQPLQSINIPVGSSMAAKISSTLTYANNVKAAAIAMGTASAKASAAAALTSAKTADDNAADALDLAKTADTNAGTVLIAATAIDANAGSLLNAATAAEMNALKTKSTNTIADANATTVKTAATTALNDANQASSDASASAVAATASAAAPLDALLIAAAKTAASVAQASAAKALATATAALTVATPETLTALTQAKTDAVAAKTAADTAVATPSLTNATAAKMAAITAQQSVNQASTTATTAQAIAVAILAASTAAETATPASVAAAVNKAVPGSAAVLAAKTAAAAGGATAQTVADAVHAIAPGSAADLAAIAAAATDATAGGIPALLLAVNGAVPDSAAVIAAALPAATGADVAAAVKAAAPGSAADIAAAAAVASSTSALLAAASAAKVVTATALIIPTTTKATTAAALTVATTTKTTTAAALTTATTAVAAANDKSSDALASLNVYDSQGNSYQLDGTFEKIADNTWSFTPQTTTKNKTGVTTANVTVSAPIVIEFNIDGTFKQSTTSATITVNPTTVIPPSPYAGAGPFTVTPNFSTMTQYGNATTVAATGQDGYASGFLTKTSTNTSGVIVGQFDNGQILNLAQVALANFNNPSGLGKSGESLYVKTTNSGEPQVGAAGSGGRGSFNSGSLEMSNVDLAQQFSDMIVTQRGFQANSKIITTTDTMLEELVNLKR